MLGSVCCFKIELEAFCKSVLFAVIGLSTMVAELIFAGTGRGEGN